MTQEPLTIHQEYLYKLASFCTALDDALRQGGLNPDESLAVWRAAVSAECTGCAIQVSGEELYALSQPPCPERATAKIGRMRLGDCARQGCEACYYRLTFQNQPGIDWQKVLSEIERIRQEQPKFVSGRTSNGHPWRVQMLSGLALRLGLALILIAMLLVVRQWRQGGRIPFIREPEHFRVDPAPQEQLSD